MHSAMQPSAVPATGGTDALLVAALRLDITAAIAAEECATEIMHDVVTAATSQMIGNHFDRLSVPYTVRCVAKEILDFIESAFVGQDSGFVRPEGWHADPVADDVLIDTWARNAVGTRQPAPRAAAPAQLTGSSPGSDTMGQTQRPRQGGGAGGSEAAKRTGANRAHLARPTGDARGGVTPDSCASTLRGGIGRPAKNGGQQRRRSDAGGPVDDAQSEAAGAVQARDIAAEEAEFARKVKAEERRREEQRQLTERLTRQMGELKPGADFCVDGPTGRVVAVRAADAKLSHSKRIEVRYTVPTRDDDGPQSPQAPPAQPRQQQGAGATQTLRSTQPRSAPAATAAAAVMSPAGNSGARKASVKTRRAASEFFQQEQSHGPMVEAVLPAGGVAVREGEATKRAELRLPTSKVSRGDFRRIVDASNAFDATGPDPDENPGSTPTATSPSAAPGGTSSSPAAPPAPAPPAAPPAPAIFGRSSSGSHGAATLPPRRPQQVAALPRTRAPALPSHEHGHHVPSPTRRALAVPPLVSPIAPHMAGVNSIGHSRVLVSAQVDLLGNIEDDR